MKFFKKGDKLYSILKLKCPHCHEGDFFKCRNLYNLRYYAASHDRCPHCKRKLYIEPGFYYGAMYVAYGFGVAHVVSFWVALLVLNLEVDYWNFIIFVAITLLLVTPLYYGLSKIVWANFFLNYKGK